MKRRSESSIGLLYGLLAYLIWGSFPLIINASEFANPFEVVVWRVVFGFLFAAVLVSIVGGWKEIFALIKSVKAMKWVSVASLFIFINWSVYVVAVSTENVIETSLGYFINPLVTVLFAVIFLKEKLRPLQWVALSIGLIAVLVLSFDYGRLPFIAQPCSPSQLSRGWCCQLLWFNFGLLLSIHQSCFFQVRLRRRSWWLLVS